MIWSGIAIKNTNQILLISKKVRKIEVVSDQIKVDTETAQTTFVPHTELSTKTIIDATGIRYTNTNHGRSNSGKNSLSAT